MTDLTALGRLFQSQSPSTAGLAVRHRLVIAEAGASRSDAAGGEAVKPSRAERREQKRRQHEAQKKAKAIDKANDKRSKARGKQDKKANKNEKKADKKRK